MDEIKEIIDYKPSPLIVNDDPRKGGKTVRLGYNTCYIVAGLLVADGKVLLIQEAKRSCRGKWYLPAGRVEQNESLEVSQSLLVIVEVDHSSSIDRRQLGGKSRKSLAMTLNQFQLLELKQIPSNGSGLLLPVSINESNTPTYGRTYVGRITGGKLKTPQEEDKESIQGQWIPIDGLDSIDLRSMDCMNVIKLAESWYTEAGLKYSHLAIPASNEMTTMRAVVLHRNNGEVNVLLRDVATGSTKLPSSPLSSPSVRHDIERLMKSTGCTGPYVTAGVYSIEHLVSSGDGIGFTLLIEAQEPGLRSGCGFHWETMRDKDLLDKMNTLLTNKISLIKLFDY